MVIEKMLERGHERVIFINNKEAGLRAIIAIHNTVLGPSLGGVRRWYYENEAAALRDVLRLSQGMTYKNAGADLPLGGGKSVIMLDEPGQPYTEAQALAMGEAIRACGGDYIAAEDVGVNEEFCDLMAERTEFVTGGVRLAKGGDPGIWTAKGVVNGMRASLKHVGGSGAFDGVIIHIMGLGSVGMNIARMLKNEGAIVRGFDINLIAIEQARDELEIAIVDDKTLFAGECNIFAPCALGGVLHADTINMLNCQIVCGAANNPLDVPERDAAHLATRGITYAPDFIVNAGGVIQLGGAWYNWEDGEVQSKIAQIEDTTLDILNRAHGRKTTTYEAAVAISKARIDAAHEPAAPSIQPH